MIFYTKNATCYKNTNNLDFYFQGSEIVEAIFLDATEYTQVSLRPNTFEKMVNLRLLVVRDHKGIKSVSLPQGLDLLPENLRYLLWDGYPSKSLPPTFFPEMLVELSLQDSQMEKLWNGVPVSTIHDLSSYFFLLFFLFLF